MTIEPLTDSSGNPYLCDDAATDTCYSGSDSVDGSSVRVDGGRTIRGDDRDAMMMFPIQTETQRYHFNSAYHDQL